MRQQIGGAGENQYQEKDPGNAAKLFVDERKNAPLLFLSSWWCEAGTSTAAVNSMPPIQKMAARM
jgi:hypothetical protein